MAPDSLSPGDPDLPPELAGPDLPPELANGLAFATATYIKGFDSLHGRAPTAAELRLLTVPYLAVAMGPLYRSEVGGGFGDQMADTVERKMASKHFQGRSPQVVYEEVVVALTAGLASQAECVRALELSVRWFALEHAPLFPHALKEASARKLYKRPTTPRGWASVPLSESGTGRSGCSVLLAILSVLTALSVAAISAVLAT